MKTLKILIASAFVALVTGVPAHSQPADLELSTGLQFQQGHRLIDGRDLNTMLDALNDINQGSFDADLLPGTDGTWDLGSTTLEWQELWIDGTAQIDSLVADTADINAGTFDGIVGGTTPAAGSFTTLGASGAITPTAGVAAAGGFSVTATLVATGGIPANAATVGTDTTIGATTEVNVAEVFVPANMTVTGISVLNGPTVGTDNYVLILYDSTGAVAANTAAAGTASAGADTYQRIAFTAPYAAVGPATYYVGVTVSGTTDNHHTHAFGDFRAGTITGQTYGTPATITPPTTFTAGDGPIASLY